MSDRTASLNHLHKSANQHECIENLKYELKIMHAALEKAITG